MGDADVHTLFYEESRGGVAGVVDSGVSDLGLAEDRLPDFPVFGSFDRAAEPGREDQVIVFPPVASLQAFGGLESTVFLQESQEGGRALQGEFGLALALAARCCDPSRGDLPLRATNAIRFDPLCFRATDGFRRSGNGPEFGRGL